jgi:hypothetical protein
MPTFTLAKKKKTKKKTFHPKLCKDKIPNTSPASKYAQYEASNIKIKDEIKYLY